MNLVGIHANAHGSSFFYVPEIGIFQVLWLKHVILTMQPKKVNEAMEFSFCMNTHMSIVSIHAKNKRSRFFHFPVIKECPFFKYEKL